MTWSFVLAEASADCLVVAAEVLRDFFHRVAVGAIGGGDRIVGGLEDLG
mgnify:CR=1 FL=1